MQTYFKARGAHIPLSLEERTSSPLILYHLRKESDAVAKAKAREAKEALLRPRTFSWEKK